MKMYKIAGITVLLIILICIYLNAQENNMDKQLPENTLAVFEIDNETVYYLLDIRPIDREESEIIAGMIDYYSIGNGDYFIQYSIIGGNYPKNYSGTSYYLHIIPQNNIYKFESKLVGWYDVENYKRIDMVFEPTDEWIFNGYSNNKNILEAKIFEYYINNRNKK